MSKVFRVSEYLFSPVFSTTPILLGLKAMGELRQVEERILDNPRFFIFFSVHWKNFRRLATG